MAEQFGAGQSSRVSAITPVSLPPLILPRFAEPVTIYVFICYREISLHCKLSDNEKSLCYN